MVRAESMHGASVQVYTELFTDATPERLEALFKYLDRDNSGVVDFLSWSRGLRLQDVPQAGPPAAALWLAPTAACWAVHRGVGPGHPVLVARLRLQDVPQVSPPAMGL